ncbi:MAG: hypothetical protein IMZ66_10690 [Planctomycetes bacterium]|nr:hypothetical protein [Planctomycetota bacterium]
MVRWLAKLRDMNPRWLYLATAILLVIPLVILIPMPAGRASRATQGLYDLVESLPADRVAMVDSSWDQGSRSENAAQLECVVRHLCARKIRFVVTSLGTPFSPTFAQRVIEPIAAKAGYVYGRDWVNTGYVQSASGLGVIIDGLARDFHQIRQADVHGTPIGDLPLMEHVRTIRDLSMIYVVTYAPSPEWISFARGQFGTPVAFGCMSMMAPNYYTYIDSGQLSGMLIGNRGAAEYEALIRHPSLGTRLSMVSSFGNAAIILAAVVGNLGMWAARRAGRRAP